MLRHSLIKHFAEMQGAFLCSKIMKGGAYMAHIHNVYDSDKHFIIDAVTMVIQNTSEKVKLSQYNHKSERFTFEIPRYIEGHDMSLCNKVEVHFNNVKSDKTVISKGVYEVDDLEVAEDENTVIFTWLISRKATKYEGTLNFCIRFACVADDATVEYARYTDIYKGITITESLFNSENVIVDYSDILEAWKQELEELAASGGGLKKVTWEDIENKPFGEVKHYPDVICDETATDRVVTEPFSIPNFGDGFYYVKVGELPTTAAEYLSKLNEFTLNNGEEYSEDIIVNEYENGAVVAPEFAPLWFIVAVDVPNAEINGGTFPESGLYFLHNEGMQIGVQKATFEGTILLDEKYMPESYSQNKDIVNGYEKRVAFLENSVKSLNNFQHLPRVSGLNDKGKFLRVNKNGVWAAETVPMAEGAEF